MDDMLKARLERAATMQGRYLELATKLGRPPTEDELNFFDHNGGHVFDNEVEEIEDSYRRDTKDWMHGKPLPPRSIKRSASFSPEIRSRVENIAKSNDIKKFWPFKRRKELTPEEAEMALIRFDMATGMSDDDPGWKDYLERHPTLKRDIEAADAKRKAKKEETSSKKASASFSPETRSRILKSANRERILRVCSGIKKYGDYEQDPLAESEDAYAQNFLTTDEREDTVEVDDNGDVIKEKPKFYIDAYGRKVLDTEGVMTQTDDFKEMYMGHDPRTLGVVDGDMRKVMTDAEKIYVPTAKQLRDNSKNKNGISNPEVIGRLQTIARRNGAPLKVPLAAFDPQGVMASNLKSKDDQIEAAYTAEMESKGLSEESTDPVEEFIFSPAFQEYMASELDWEFDDNFDVVNSTTREEIPWVLVREYAAVYKKAIEEEAMEKFKGKGTDEMNSYVNTYGID